MSDQNAAAESNPYEIRSFPVRRQVDGVDPRLSKWVQAVSFGFHDGAVDEETIEKYLASEEKDGRTATGVYAATSLKGAWDADYPVATYAAHRKTLNVGAGTLLPVHMITAVTVRSSHRRRGLLRSMITADLQQAKDDGLPMAALTASEASIYGRFGFGPATHHTSVDIDAGPTFAFRNPAAANRGLVEVADPVVLQDLEPVLFERIHAATFGSIARQDSYRYQASGYWSYANPERDKAVRAALHYGADGGVDGYVSYKFKGWDEKPAAVEVVDLLAVDADAYLALWNYLGSLDLVGKVVRHGAPVEDPLEWALANKRHYRRTRVSDHLWLRILDTKAALEARAWHHDAVVVLKVTDLLGHAGGVFEVKVAGGSASVTELVHDELVDEPRIHAELGIAELSSLYLGDVSPATLAAAGTLRGLVPGAVERLQTLFGVPVRAHSLTDF
ncbi:GNAT family N-acetyltransferase [Arthrobacter sp. 35W]|uniref:GNAT family N-acetyltransferase n=1 Tax=Arthrobacter sp. 35W TaxID=1132441 RepID=UPI0003F99D70|nr:GNAT family N-acetyltransferase [Arthrobacter sp. 35W]